MTSCTRASGNNQDPVIRYVMRQGPTAWLRDLPIGSKLLASFGLLFLLLGLSLAAILFYLTRINSYVERHHRITVPALVAAAGMRQQTLQMGLELAASLDNRSQAEREAIVQQLAETAAAIQSQLHRYRTTHAARTHPVLFRMLSQHGRADLADQEDVALAQARQLFDRWQQQLGPLHDALLLGRLPDLHRRIRDNQTAIQQLSDAFTALIDVNTMITAEMKAEGDSLQQQARLVILALTLLVGAVTVGVFAMTRAQIAVPLQRLAMTADRVARQDLSADFDPRHTQDEVGRLAESLRTMLGTLREQTRSLERKTRELESFTYSAAHDLKGPLREIEGFSTLLARNHSAGMEPTARHYLAMIRSSTLRLAALIDDLLRYSRLEQQALSHSVIDLRAMIDGVMAEQLRGATSVPAVHIDLPSCDLRGEPASVRQAFVNLVGNAIKFSHHTPQPEISIGGRVTGGELVVWVKDNGIGFDSSESERIFGLFERLHQPNDYEGTGVGLAIVRLVMNKHGGRAWAESSPGKGSTFYLAFPLSKVSPAAHTDRR
jgi:signal transduction histidine kinase